MDTPTALTDRYQLTAHLARGGMADVYQGLDGLLGRRVAIKVLHSTLSSDEAFVKRFRKEAQAAANLTHPNIVGIYDWGQFDSTYFIVMELVEGRSLREVLRSEGALLPRRAVEITAEVAAALSVAHRAGLVHRDVKPGNILLAPDGTVKVTDFGIARAWDDSQELTRTGAVMGTATYFSPEQAQGNKVDERSDIYSLGVVLYEMLTGTPPFRGDSPVSVAYQHVSSDALAPSQVNPDVPPELDAVVMRAMQKDPAARYQTAEELRADLWRALHGEKPLAAAPLGNPGDDGATRMMPATPPPTVPPDEAYRQLEEPPSSNLAFVLGTFALLATLAVLVFLIFDLLNGGGTPEAQLVQIPEVTGMTEQQALATLQSEGLIAIPERQPDNTVEENLVIRTDPPAGTEVEEGTTVTVFVSLGTEQVSVPLVTGVEQAAAEDTLRSAGLEVGEVTTQPHPEQPAGIVIAQNPPTGTPVDAGTPVDLVVSSGPEAVVVPNLVGSSEGDAQDALQELGLVWTVEEEASSEVPEGSVIRTEPEAGTELAPGDEVLLVVSTGPEQIDVPDLRGLTEQEARTRLEELGLVLQVNQGRLEVDDPSQIDRVVEQQPPPGAVVTQGDVVRVTLGEAPDPTTTTSTTTTSTTTTTTTTEGG